MKNSEHIKYIANTLDILAQSFYMVPTEESIDKFYNIDTKLLKLDNIDSRYEAKHRDDLKIHGGNKASFIEIKKDFNSLFTRPKNKLAPPWGSVYLSSKNRLFDKSTLIFMGFCKKYNINYQLKQHEPIDHFGLILASLVHCLMLDLTDQQERAKELLENHLLMWSDRFIELVIENSNKDFYPAVAELCQLVLAELKHHHKIKIEPVALYN